MTIYDYEGHVISSYPKRKSPFCALLESNKSSKNMCNTCDLKAMEVAKKTGKIYIYKCWCGLYEAIVPLYTYGALSGYFMMGQTIDEKDNINEILNNCGLNNPKLEGSLKLTKKYSYSQIEAFGKLVDICAKYLTLINGVEINSENLGKEIQQYLLSHYSEDISFEKLVNYFNVSRGTLHNHFKETFNTTIHQRLLSIRLNEARKLLSTTSLSIKEIAHEVGFEDSDYFSRAYKKMYGFSPSNTKNMK